MALVTPIDLTQRGLTANAGVLTSKYPHGQLICETTTKTRSATFSGADAAIVKGAAVATSDVFPLISIPAGAFVHTVTHTVTTVEGGTCTYDIGDVTTPAGYVVAATSGNGNAATNLSSFNGTTTPTYGVGKYYPAAATIDLRLTTGTAAAVVIKVSATYSHTAPVAN